jgi:hypothetical protein
MTDEEIRWMGHYAPQITEKTGKPCPTAATRPDKLRNPGIV